MGYIIKLRDLLNLINSRHTIWVYRETVDSPTQRYKEDDGGECAADAPRNEPTKWEKSYGEKKLKIETNLYGHPSKVIPEEWLNGEVECQFPTPDGHLVIHLKSRGY